MGPSTMEACEEGRKQYKKDRSEKVVKSCSECLFWVLVSMSGGLLLSWWVYRHHPSNTQLWMVPFGLVLFLTPLFVSLSLFFSDLCNLPPQDRRPDLIKRVTVL